MAARYNCAAPDTATSMCLVQLHLVLFDPTILLLWCKANIPYWSSTYFLCFENKDSNTFTTCSGVSLLSAVFEPGMETGILKFGDLINSYRKMRGKLWAACLGASAYVILGLNNCYPSISSLEHIFYTLGLPFCIAAHICRHQIRCGYFHFSDELPLQPIWTSQHSPACTRKERLPWKAIKGMHIRAADSSVPAKT